MGRLTKGDRKLNKKKLIEMLWFEISYYERCLKSLDYNDDMEYGVSIGYDVAKQRIQGIIELAEKL